MGVRELGQPERDRDGYLLEGVKVLLVVICVCIHSRSLPFSE